MGSPSKSVRGVDDASRPPPGSDGSRPAPELILVSTRVTRMTGRDPSFPARISRGPRPPGLLPVCLVVARGATFVGALPEVSAPRARFGRRAWDHHRAGDGRCIFAPLAAPPRGRTEPAQRAPHTKCSHPVRQGEEALSFSVLLRVRARHDTCYLRGQVLVSVTLFVLLSLREPDDAHRYRGTRTTSRRLPGQTFDCV